MKRLFFTFSLFAMLLTSCETVSEGTDFIKLTSKESVNVGSGSSMGYISYDLLTPVEGATVEATATVEWIGDFDYAQMGKIMYNVEKNPAEEARTGEIVVTYGNDSFKVTITQAANPAPTFKSVTVPHLIGSYYGIQGGMYNYYLAFTDIATDNNYNCPNAIYYFVDLYMLQEPEDMNNITVPLGEYDFDISNSGIPGTFVESFSWYQINDSGGYPSPETQLSYETGKLIVEEGKLTLSVTLTIDGIQENHVVVYEGDYSLRDESNIGQ